MLGSFALDVYCPAKGDDGGEAEQEEKVRGQHACGVVWYGLVCVVACCVLGGAMSFWSSTCPV